MKLHLLLCPDCNSPNTDLSVWVSSIDPTPASCNGSGECLDQVYCNTCDTTHKHRHCAQVTVDLEKAVLHGATASGIARGIKAQVDEDLAAEAEPDDLGKQVELNRKDTSFSLAHQLKRIAKLEHQNSALVYRVEELEQHDYTRKGQVERLRDRLDELTGADQEPPAEPPRDQASDLRDQCMTIKDERQP